ncbi:MAG: TetR/AcrR family transcriptional regulator [Solirubrobacteraceae bacterium]
MEETGHHRLTAEARRARIADAATLLFAERGYHAASLDAIARAAGITKPVIYDHFISKADLHLQLLAHERDRLLALTSAAKAPADALEAFFVYVESHPHAWRMLFRETTGDPTVAAEHQQILAEARAGIAGEIGRRAGLRGRGRSRRLELLAEGVMGVTHGLALWWQAHPDVPREEIVRAATDLLVPGFERLLSTSRK